MQEYKVKVYDSATEWYNLKGHLHREDGPAVEWASGTKLWYLNGQRHRTLLDAGPRIWRACGKL